MKKLISVIAPMYNEENLVFAYIAETLKVLESIADDYDYEIILVNDGSQDHTLQKMIEAQALYPDHLGIVNLTRNFGLEGAINAGLKSINSDAVIVMDADLQDPPALMLEMIKKWENGADIVSASRASREHDSFFKRFTAQLYYQFLRSLAGRLKLELNAANYRLLSRKALDVLLSFPEVNTYFRVNVPFLGMKTDSVEYSRDERMSGKTKYGFASLFRCALDGITSISIEPLNKMFSLTVFTSGLFLLFLVVSFFLVNEWKLFFLYLTGISFFFNILFFLLAIIAVYIGQIMIEVRGRPTSLVYDYRPAKKNINEENDCK